MLTDFSPGLSARQLPLPLAALLHLLPGVLTILFFIFFGSPIASSLGFPPSFGFLLVKALILIPFELGLLFWLSRQRNGNFTLEGIVLYRRSLPWRELIPVIVGLFIGVSVWVQFQSPIDTFFFDRFFGWLPNWFLIDKSPLGFPSSTVLLTYSMSFVLTGLIGPLTEELYFHGYLLPRLSRFGVWAPVINSSLFMLYHFHDPWRFVTRMMIAVPLAIVIQRKQSISFAIGFHCIGNIAGEVLAFLAWRSG